MKRSELRKMTRRELYEMAKAYDIAGRSSMAKDDLVEALGRVSAKKVVPKPRPQKRRMAKRRRRRTVKVHTTKAQTAKKASSTVVQAPPEVPQPLEAYIDRGPELPQDYGQDKLMVMVRDPNWVHAYWDLSGGALDRLGALRGTWVLRVHNLDEKSHEDIPVLIDGGNWYLPVASDTEYMVEIGVVDAAGMFHLAAASISVKTPPVGISELVDEEWLILEDELRQLMEISGEPFDRFSGSRFLSEIVSRRQRSGGMGSGAVSSLATRRRR